MALGTVIVFNQAREDVGNAVHNYSGSSPHTFYLGLTDGSTTPATTTAAPHWGGTGTTDFSAEEASPIVGGNYTGPFEVTLTWGDDTVTPDPSIMILGMTDGAELTISSHASNPTNARYAIVYNNTDANKRAIFAIDLGTSLDLTTNSINLNPSSGGIYRTS